MVNFTNPTTSRTQWLMLRSLILGILLFVGFGGGCDGCKPKCDPACKDCEEACVAGVCKPSGMKKCTDGRCIAQNINSPIDPCSCNPSCDTCTSRCGANGQCLAKDGYLRCPSGACVFGDSSMCDGCGGKPCPPCQSCEMQQDGTTKCDGSEGTCPDGTCKEASNESCPNECSPVCKQCLETCFNGMCQGVPNKICPDGTCRGIEENC